MERQRIFIVKDVIPKMSFVSQIEATGFLSKQNKRECIWKDCGFE